jgi:DNA-binding beta-propeller fold protein YncE
LRNLYVADGANYTIRKIEAATGVVTTLAGLAGMSGSADGVGAAARFMYPQDVVADKRGNLYMADASSNTIRKIVTATGEVTTLASATDARFSPLSLALDDSGNLYVAGSYAGLPSGLVRKVVLATGTVTTVVGTVGQMGLVPGALPGSLGLSRGLGWVPNQGLALSDYDENVVLLARGL